ncbi:MAG: hypothetical protein GWP91_10510 [Rhodobacterales bacterium]|nr:hypothetical protein [Rhodobacterales bacterium]
MPFFANFGPTDDSVRLMWVIVWQLLKLPLTIGRTNDLGRSPDDALFTTLIPVANAYGWYKFGIAPTPSKKRWAKARSRWNGQVNWYNLIPQALGLMAKTAPVGLGLLVLVSVPATLILDQMEKWIPVLQALPPESLSNYASAALGVSGFLGLYSGLQTMKRKTASPTSWLPVIFFVPSLCIVGLFAALASPNFNTLVPLISAALAMPFILVWYSFMGTFVTLAWTANMHVAETGEGDSGDAMALVKQRLSQVLPAGAARVQWVQVGGQMFVPGLFYWVYSAFVIPAGLLENPVVHPLTNRSGDLSWGMMSRLVKLCVVYVTVMMVPSLAFVVLRHGGAVATAMMTGDLVSVPLSTQIVVDLYSNGVYWWVTATLYLMYQGRVAQLRERVEAQAVSIEMS